jgi:twinkle protein
MQKIDITDKELLGFIGKQESQEIGTFDSYGDRLLKQLEGGSGLVGDKLPWSKTHSAVRLGQGQLSIWSGINGHGKTLLLSNVFTYLMARGRRCLVASMEMKPEETLQWMCSQAAGCSPSKDFALGWLDRMKEVGHIYDCLDKVPQERVLGLVHYAGQELDINHLAIDSLTMCGVGREDYTAQGEFVNQLRAAAKMYNMHIHLVGKFSIRGAGEISDLADKVFVVFRNKAREKAIAIRDDPNNKYPFNEKYLTEPDVYLKLVKNRQDGTELDFGLYFHKDSMQFTSREGKAMPLEGNVGDY